MNTCPACGDHFDYEPYLYGFCADCDYMAATDEMEDPDDDIEDE